MSLSELGYYFYIGSLVFGIAGMLVMGYVVIDAVSNPHWMLR